MSVAEPMPMTSDDDDVTPLLHERLHARWKDLAASIANTSDDDVSPTKTLSAWYNGKSGGESQTGDDTEQEDLFSRRRSASLVTLSWWYDERAVLIQDAEVGTPAVDGDAAGGVAASPTLRSIKERWMDNKTTPPSGVTEKTQAFSLETPRP